MEDSPEKRLGAIEIELARTDERWQEQWRWKNTTEGRLNDMEEKVNNVQQLQAVTSTEMKAQVRLWSFLGSIAGGVIVGVILWILKGA